MLNYGRHGCIITFDTNVKTRSVSLIEDVRFINIARESTEE